MTDLTSLIQTATAIGSTANQVSGFNWQQIIELVMTLVGALFTYSFHTNLKSGKSEKILNTVMSVVDEQVHSVEQSSSNLKVPMYSGEKKDTAIKVAKQTLHATKLNVPDDVLGNLIESSVHKMKVNGEETKSNTKVVETPVTTSTVSESASTLITK